MKVLILGAGKMVEAILEGLKNESDLSHFYVYSPSGKSAVQLAKKIGINFVTSLDEIKDPDWIWLGCKPQQLNHLASSIEGRFPNATYLSMLAALAEVDQLKILGAAKLVRIMPNMPVKFKKGVTLISSNSAASELKQVLNLFSLIGLAKVVKENELEELTLLTGSGPALFYEFSKMLAGSFTSLTESEREDLARMVLAGSGVSATGSVETLSEMISSVTSKGGVTIAVLESWKQLKLNELIGNGVAAGKQRSSQIRESLRRN